jgi:MscS family membrane protein
LCSFAGAQVTAPAPAPAKPDTPSDALGRDNPRGTVLGFLNVSRKDDFETAAKYLNTRLNAKAAAELAHQLFTVLDLRLPARLNELSDKPEGSRYDLGNPDTDLVGVISSETQKVDILVERVARGKDPPVWLFSAKTLDKIPDLYENVSAVPIENLIPRFLIQTRIGPIPLFALLVVFVLMPLIYLAFALVSRLISPYVGEARRKLTKRSNLPDFEVIPPPFRLLFIAVLIAWGVNKIGLSLFARQFWSTVAWVLTAAAAVWMLVLCNSFLERLAHRRIRKSGAAAILHLGRRVLDILIVFAGVISALYHFGFNPTAALAGLGIGGIAIAFAAQKTLENVIGGISVIFDQVVRVGDFIKAGDTTGTVDSIGLRSTRIRTLDRTLVSVPNGLISGVTLENMSDRDKFWFHHTVGVRYETSVAQMRNLLDSMNELLALRPDVERESVRVRFLSLGASSLNIELFAYISAEDYSKFLEIQGELLLRIMELVEAAGSSIAFPSQTLYLHSPAGNGSSNAQALLTAAESENAAPRG